MANYPIKTIKPGAFPKLLCEIHDPPEKLYVRGDIDPDAKMFAVVGTRKPSSYGKQVTPRIVQELSRAGLTIVSGLAYGIDTLAHEAVLDANGKTIAVLGSGIDDKTLYPQTNLRLAHRILENGGAVISEYPEGAEPFKGNFPARNRIIAGLSIGVLVVEAPLKSGSLITANLAVQENRDVLAIPGPITSSNSMGTNLLIKQGATPVTETEDVLQMLGIESIKDSGIQRVNEFTEEEQRIFEALQEESLHVDVIIEQTGFAAAALNTLLTTMELEGKIRHLGGGVYARC